MTVCVHEGGGGDVGGGELRRVRGSDGVGAVVVGMAAGRRTQASVLRRNPPLSYQWTTATSSLLLVQPLANSSFVGFPHLHSSKRVRTSIQSFTFPTGGGRREA